PRKSKQLFPDSRDRKRNLASSLRADSRPVNQSRSNMRRSNLRATILHPATKHGMRAHSANFLRLISRHLLGLFQLAPPKRIQSSLHTVYIRQIETLLRPNVAGSR